MTTKIEIIGADTIEELVHKTNELFNNTINKEKEALDRVKKSPLHKLLEKL